MEKFSLKNIGKYQDDWALVYLDPDNTYSDCGGRITVILGDYVGTAFFGHCGTKTFKEFIAQTNPSYLINKMFNGHNSIDEDVFIESGDEILKRIYIKKDVIKELREYRDERVSKDALRSLYNALFDQEFNHLEGLYRHLDSGEQNTLDALYGEEWSWGDSLKKSNPCYEYVESMIQAVINHFKDEVAA
ncbi:hypothetical protein GCM10023206_07310 [Acinetobacter puyangensis]